MSDQIDDEIASCLYLSLYFSLGLFEDSPFGQVAIDQFHVVILAVVVYLHLNQTALGCLQPFMNNFQVVVILSPCLLSLRNHLLLYLQLAHAHREDDGRDYTLLI